MNIQTVLSIQSCVSYGHVGNSAITFPLQRLGFNVVPIHSVCFSNHTGYGQWQGVIFEPQTIRDIFLGIQQRGFYCDILLNGYMGSVALGEVMDDVYSELVTINPALIYCCDPVMGDIDRGFFVQPGIPEFFRDYLVPKATITTPNQFELAFLSGQSINSIDNALSACRQLITNGVKIVLVTSLQWYEPFMYMLAVDQHQAFMTKTPLLPLSVNGAGDLTAALFTAFYAKTRDIKQALEACTARIFGVLTVTLANHQKELALIAAQDCLLQPKDWFVGKAL